MDNTTSNPSTSAASTLPFPATLTALAAQAQSEGEPLVLLVSTPGCVYCKLVLQNYLLPLRKNAGLHAYQIEANAGNSPEVAKVLSWSSAGADVGNWLSPAEWVARYKVRRYPTVFFFSGDGRELAPRLEGMSVDFYNTYLEGRLAQARLGLAKK